MKTIIRQFVAIFLSMTIVFVSVPSFAAYDPNSRNGQWLVDRITADPTLKGTTNITAQRTYPVSTLGADGKPIIQQKVQKSTIKLAPKAANVGKSLIKRAPAIAITQAVIALLGKGVDWLMDAENNRVKYKVTSSTRMDEWCIAQIGTSGRKFAQVVFYNNRYYCAESDGYKWGLIPDTLPKPTTEEKYIPIDQVAQKVIDQANSATASTGSNTGSDGGAALQVMSDTALDMLEQGLLDAQLEAAAESKIFNEGESDPTDPNAPTDPDAPTDPNAPPKDESAPFELPPFCSWATKVCDFIDWVQAEPDIAEEDTAVDIDLPDTSAEDTNIDFGGSCPAPFVFNGSIFGNSFSMTLLDTAMLCDFLSTYVKYPVYAVSSLYALYIFGGRKDV